MPLQVVVASGSVGKLSKQTRNAQAASRKNKREGGGGIPADEPPALVVIGFNNAHGINVDYKGPPYTFIKVKYDGKDYTAADSPWPFGIQCYAVAILDAGLIDFGAEGRHRGYLTKWAAQWTTQELFDLYNDKFRNVPMHGLTIIGHGNGRVLVQV